MFFFGGSWFTILYYIPLYFQSVHASSAIGSGVRMLALIIPMTIAAIIQGFALMKVGIVPLFWILGAALGAIGGGLFYTMDQNTSVGKWIGYQIIVGFTNGATFQVAVANAQVQASPEDMSQVMAIVNCKCHHLETPLLPANVMPVLLTIGGAFLLSAAQCAFNNQLIHHLAKSLPDIDPRIALGIGATEIRKAFTAGQVPAVIEAYVQGLKAVFALVVAAYGVATMLGMLGSWKRLGEEELKAAAGGGA